MSIEPTNDNKPMGRGMLVIAWVLILGVLILVFGGWEERQFNPNQELRATSTGDVREVTLVGNRHHHYVATGTINGEEVVFLLDTGATDVVVSQELARDLTLRAGARGYAQTANGTVEVRMTSLESVTLGPIELQDVRASINPGMDGKEVLLGMSALRHLELIQRDNQLIIRQNLR